jgi:hypothetical protein
MEHFSGSVAERIVRASGTKRKTLPFSGLVMFSELEVCKQNTQDDVLTTTADFGF